MEIPRCWNRMCPQENREADTETSASSGIVGFQALGSGTGSPHFYISLESTSTHLLRLPFQTSSPVACIRTQLPVRGQCPSPSTEVKQDGTGYDQPPAVAMDRGLRQEQRWPQEARNESSTAPSIWSSGQGQSSLR